jgi:hypothetical protein
MRVTRRQLRSGIDEWIDIIEKNQIICFAKIVELGRRLDLFRHFATAAFSEPRAATVREPDAAIVAAGRSSGTPVLSARQ